MNIESERERLSQAKFLLWIRNQMELGEMVTVYWSEIENQHNYGVYPVLIPTSKIEESLSDPSWHSTYGDGSPGTVQYYREGEEKIEYLRFGNDEGLEPLVIDRYFDGVRPTYKELGRRSAERHPHPQNLARCPRRTRSRMTNRTLCSFSDLSSLSTSVSLSQGGHLAALAEHHLEPLLRRQRGQIVQLELNFRTLVVRACLQDRHNLCLAREHNIAPAHYHYSTTFPPPRQAPGRESR